MGVSLCMLVGVCLWVCIHSTKNLALDSSQSFCHPDALCAGMPTLSKDSFVISNRENLASDCFQGCFVVTCTLCAFISLVWLREQILHGGGPDWLEQDNQAANQARVRCTESEKVIWEE